jgi:hypothetical protein
LQEVTQGFCCGMPLAFFLLSLKKNWNPFVLPSSLSSLSQCRRFIVFFSGIVGTSVRKKINVAEA